MHYEDRTIFTRRGKIKFLQCFNKKSASVKICEVFVKKKLLHKQYIFIHNTSAHLVLGRQVEEAFPNSKDAFEVRNKKSLCILQIQSSNKVLKCSDFFTIKIGKHYGAWHCTIMA